MQKAIQSILFTITVLVSFCGYSQTKNGVVRFYAFLQESTKGNIPVDDNGRPMESGVMRNYIVFVETTGKIIPRFDTVYTKMGAYAVEAVEIVEGTKNIGKLKDAVRDSTIKVKRGNRLWQFSLTAVDANPPAAVNKMLTKNQLVVAGRFNTRKFKTAIPKSSRLETIFFQ